MRNVLRCIAPQPLVAVVTALVAAGATYAVWTNVSYRADFGNPYLPILLIVLAVATVLAYRFPIHMRHGAKVCMISVQLYLMAVLLPPELAAVTAATSTLAGEISVRSQRGGVLADLVTQAARWTLIILLAAIVGHLPASGALRFLPLILAAVVCWAGDILTFPLLLSPITHENPLVLIHAGLREAGLPEGAQYLVGILGALAAMQSLFAVGLLFIPTVMVYLAFKSAREMRESTRHILESMADTVDLRDPSTGGHSRRVTELTARTLALLEEHGPEADLIVAAARVHDIGKIGIPDDVLMKPELLTNEERVIMETHADRGAQLLSRYPDFAHGVDIVRHHHERWDGLGYPRGLRGRDIPYGARVVAVADSFDAMTSDRPYRQAMSRAHAVAILQAGRGMQWDPDVVDAFLRAIGEMPNVPVSVEHRPDVAPLVYGN